MIRKLKNILHKENGPLQVPNSCDMHSLEPVSTSVKTNPDLNSSPVNFIKRKIKSSKSWAKIPKHKFFQEESIYATVTSPELASQEFENFTRPFNYGNSTNNASSLDYGFGSRAPSMSLNSPVPSSIINVNENRMQKQSTIDTRNCNIRSSLRHTSNSCFSHCTNNDHRINERDNYFYFKIIQRLKRCSIESPANIPILTIHSFKSNMPKWIYLTQQFISFHKNDMRLIDLDHGVPVNALFYSTDFDLIYVRTAEEIEGYVPRDNCKPIVASEEKANNGGKNCVNNDHDINSGNLIQSCYAALPGNFENYKENDMNCSGEDGSIKYHSLSIGTDYENVQNDDENPYSNIPIESETNSREKIDQNFDYLCAKTHDLVKNLNSDTRDTRDSGYRSDAENANQFSNNLLDNDYENTVDYVIDNLAAESHVGKCLENMQSRSRLPISVSSNLNLTVMNDRVGKRLENTIENDDFKASLGSYNNPIYKSPSPVISNSEQSLMSSLNKKTPSLETSAFQRSKIRRSLDSNLLLDSQKTTFQSVEINIDETSTNYNRTLHLFKQKENSQAQRQPYPDLDVNKIELDSMTDNCQVPINIINKVKKLWTVVLEHKANACQEISVMPGMLVIVVKQYKNWLYIKLVESDNLGTAKNSAPQMYGFIPRYCAVDLQEIIAKSNLSQMANVPNFKTRRSQITAL